MAAPEFVTQADLVSRVGADTVKQLFDDDGDGIADAGALAAVLEDANRLTESHLVLRGFSRDQLALLAADATLRRCACDIALGFAGRRKPEWLDQNGVGRYDAIQKMAEKNLDLIAQGSLRVAAETEAGANRSIRGAIRTPDPLFVFAGSKSCPKGPGGF